MAHYKVVYKIDEFKTPHSRFYTAIDESTARLMFKATCEESLVGSNTKILEVSELKDPDSDCCDSGCGCNTK